MSFPWGIQNPDGGYQRGDYVGIIYSDHQEYIFDNPKGVVTDLNDGMVTIRLEVRCNPEKLYLIER